MAVLQVPTWAIRYEIVDPTRPRKTPRWSKWHFLEVALEAEIISRVQADDTWLAKTVCLKLITNEHAGKIQVKTVSDLTAANFCKKCLGPIVPRQTGRVEVSMFVTGQVIEKEPAAGFSQVHLLLTRTQILRMFETLARRMLKRGKARFVVTFYGSMQTGDFRRKVDNLEITDVEVPDDDKE